MDSSAGGLVFDIQRFCTQDGPGIRTVVFLKGCPLRCPWCHNPESRSHEAQVRFNPTLCAFCGACVATCTHAAHHIDDHTHRFDRARCIVCLGCVSACPSGALEAVGRRMKVVEVLDELQKDRVFYEESCGGITLSGGEPMAQAQFSRAILAGARAAGLHTCVETCGMAPADAWTETMPLVDLFLWDIKHSDEDAHRRLTGACLSTVLDNLRRIDAAGAKSRLRCVLLAGVNLNPGHLDGVARIFLDLRCCEGVDLLPFHPLGEAKRAALGMPTEFETEWTPTPQDVTAAAQYLRDRWSIPAAVV